PPNGLPVLSAPGGDAFPPSVKERPANRWKAALFTVLSVFLFALVVSLNYLRALRWAGFINAESFGYMMGGVIFYPLLGLLAMYVVKRLRGRALEPASKALGAICVAVFLSFAGLVGE